ncbi:MAG: hypothetical protein J6X47_03255 [Clostridia bacterium]|nr:hypothetical protein [Clostridia bacterium]
MNTRMDRKRLNIGTYHLKPYARTEQHVKDLADCGIDFVICMDYDVKTLDLFAKHGVGAIVSGVVPGWWGGDGDNAGTLEAKNPLSRCFDAAAKFKDHPAIWGIDIGDEPSALDFPHYGKIYDAVNGAFPKQFPYLNLYPNYASVSKNTEDQALSQLGTRTYDEHIQKYCELVPADYISYDFYVYCTTVRKCYENLVTVADACRRTGRSMWIILQVNSHVPQGWMNEDMLRFQAFSSMAFGAENITWACYTAGWWYNQVLDEKGEKTVQYDRLRKVNGEIRAMAPLYMKYLSTATHFVGFDTVADIDGSSIVSVKSLNTGYFRNLKADDGLPLVVGEMNSREGDGSRALFVFAADDWKGENRKHRRVTFETTGAAPALSAFCPEGIKQLDKNPDGSCSFDIDSNGCCMVVLRP